MRKIAMLFLLINSAVAQESPHGQLSIACEACHSADSWKLNPHGSFNHDSTGFALQGRHRVIKCASCHENLVFKKKNPECTTCHTDVHKSELGSFCLRCHTMDSWIIADMKQKHQQTRFPLVGNHALADCEACHARASAHQYAGTPLTCISCHRTEFQATTSPNHIAQGFPIDCSQCHAVDALGWPAKFDHNLTTFPLTGAHRAVLCAQCHGNGQFARISADCYSCHSQNFAQAQSPDHAAAGFSHACQTCHTTTAWSPSTFNHDQAYFRIYSGRHQGKWSACSTCHQNNSNYAEFTCLTCHTQANTDPNHTGVSRYVYSSPACYSCHRGA